MNLNVCAGIFFHFLLLLEHHTLFLTVRVNLDENMRCRIFNSPERPAVCGSLQPCEEMCGSCREEALQFLTELENLTRP